MHAVTIVDIVTPKKVLLKGLWIGSPKSRRAIIFVHGLGGSVFSMLPVVEKMVDRETTVLTFNNRGHGIVNRIKSRTVKKSALGGAAHEKFSDCIDDIDGAVRFAKRYGAKAVYLMGHSTGCQKSVYWASKGGRGVKGIILLAPVSDYAAGLKQHGKTKLARVAKKAQALVASGKKHTLLSPPIWKETIDAQRFLSLYTQESVENIFTYGKNARVPKALQKVKQPILVMWAGKDEYSENNVGEISAWFSKNVSSRKSEVQVVKNANHGFKKAEADVRNRVRKWLEKL